MKLALLGYPLTHSLSPAMHNAALEAVGLADWRYQALPAAPDRLGGAVAVLRDEAYAGANVTVPHKEAVIRFLDTLTPVAEAIGAVNTIVKEVRAHGGAPLIGHNTDAAGFLADLHALDVNAARRRVLILGAGGAARAVVAACAGVGAQVRVVARRREQAEALRALAPVEVFDWTALGFLQACDGCALIVNCTPIGLSPRTGESPWLEGTPFPPEAFVYDTVYNPPDTQFTRQARAEGLRAATGLGMLVEQGALAFELWTGKTAPRALMRRAAEQALRSHLLPGPPAHRLRCRGAGESEG